MAVCEHEFNGILIAAMLTFEMFSNLIISTLHIGLKFVILGFLYLSTYGHTRGSKMSGAIYRNTTKLQKVRVCRQVANMAVANLAKKKYGFKMLKIA